MDTMGITTEEQKEIFRLCFAILFLGNIQFSQNEKDEAFVSNQDGTREWINVLALLNCV